MARRDLGPDHVQVNKGFLLLDLINQPGFLLNFRMIPNAVNCLRMIRPLPTFAIYE